MATHFQSVPLFATNNTYGYTEFAEEFQAKGTVQAAGVFIAPPATTDIANMNLRVRVYSGENQPERLLYEPYNYSYSITLQGIPVYRRDMRHSVENYIPFEVPVRFEIVFHLLSRC